MRRRRPVPEAEDGPLLASAAILVGFPHRRATRGAPFGLDGSDYEIDLSKRNAAAFRRKLAPFLEHARKAGRGHRRRPGRAAASRDRSGGIRAWAKGQGIAVSERGRIPASVVEQYEAATTGR